MKKVYLDNAATTAPRREVILEMGEVMLHEFGNPSSAHGFGRSAKSIVELARKNIAGLIGASAQEIIFTSGGTESDNWIIRYAVRKHQLKRIVTTRVEHHAVLETAHDLEAFDHIDVHYLKVSGEGLIDISELTSVLSDNVPTLVTLMHVNNETGAVTDLEAVGNICRAHGALFHTDAIQSMAKVEFDLHHLPVDFLSASAHKFHGPKGIGFAYIRKGVALAPMMTGGEQEKGMRAGTEAVHNIAGMSMALSMSMQNLHAESERIRRLKTYLIDQFENHFPGYKINGGTDAFYTIANVMLPMPAEKAAMLLFHLDIKGIAVSRGSACQSGSAKPSHVLAEMLSGEDLLKPSLRISFSHENTTSDIDDLILALKAI